MILQEKSFTVTPSPKDERDFVLSADLIDDDIKAEDFILNGELSSHKAHNQGSTSMCVGFGLGGAISQLQLEKTGVEMRLSPGSLYGNRFNVNEYQGEGQFIRNSLGDAYTDGVAKFEDFPFLGSVGECKTKFENLSDTIREDMLNQKINTYYSINMRDPQSAYGFMTKFHKPITIGYMIYQSMGNAFHNGGIIENPEDGEVSLGGHCSYIVGLKNIKGRAYWIVVNSWGDHIFDNGIMYLPIRYPGIFEGWMAFPYTKTDIRLNIHQKYYTINGERKEMDTAPVLINERTYVPLRFLMEAIGALDVIWNAKGRTSVVYYSGDTLFFKEGSESFSSSIMMKALPFETDEERQGLTKIYINDDDRMMVPLRAVFEFCGWSIGWDNELKEVTLQNFKGE